MLRKVWILDWCYMCKKNEKLVDQLSLHCPIVLELWSMEFTFGIYWVMPKTLVELLACQQGKLGLHRNGVIWMAVSHCLMWCIWLERNNRSFEDSKRTLAYLKLFFFKTLPDWMSIIGSLSISLVHDLMDASNLSF